MIARTKNILIPRPQNRWKLLVWFLVLFTLASFVRHTFSSSFHSSGFWANDPSERYFEVKELMQNGFWKQANTDTVEIALSVAGRSDEGWFDSDSIERFPCPDLYYIDQLFQEHSEGKFGLTAQKEVYKSIVAQNPDLSQREIYLKFAEAVGWIKDDQFIAYADLFFELDKAPKGHLPVKVPPEIIRPAFKSRHGAPDSPSNFPRLVERVKICSPAS